MARNELDKAASPYLLQHRDNPVHWKEWGQVTLAEAQAAGKPILLSIGYAACHWCHVMAHESFEDESTAELMNSLFINVKVDREERPDIDQIYMAALHALGQPGGWPLTMFLTPTGEPFWGGTYFPKEAAYGRPSFRQVLQEVARTFNEAPEKVSNNVRALRKAVTQSIASEESGAITNPILDDFARRLYPHMDDVNGGMQGSPKFPNSQILELFWRAAERSGDAKFRHPVLLTLRQMIRGGIHDHVGGGFARYSVDDRWHVPHFEKMLYDNAQILDLLSVAWAQTGDHVFQNAAESMVGWLQREMIVEGHAFAASMDADSEGVEGKYYCWTAEEIRQVLTHDEANLFGQHYDVQDGGNWQEAHTGMRTNVLNRLQDDNITQETEARLAPLREKLLAARQHRIPPLRDDKLLADWNGLMIAALADASFAFDRRDWLDLARAAFRFVIDSMTREENGFLRVAHSYREGKYVWPGMASDYTYLIQAALALRSHDRSGKITLHGSTDISYLAIAKRLADTVIEFHADSDTGVLSLPARDSSDVIYRTFNTNDDATPNPNGVLLHTLHLISAVTGEMKYFETARRMTQAITSQALKNPFGNATFLNALDTGLNGTQIIFVGSDTSSIAAAARDATKLNRFVVELDNISSGDSQRFADSDYERKAVAYICSGQACSLPLANDESIKAALNS